MLSKYRWIISIIFLSVLVFIFTTLDMTAVYGQVLNSNKLFLTLGVLSLVLVILLKIARFCLISRYCSYSLTFKQASLVEIVGISLAMLTPGRVGEGSKAIIMNRQFGIPLASSFSVIVLERLMDIALLAIGAFFFTFYILKDGRIVFLIGLFAVFLVTSLVVFLRYSDVIMNVIPNRYRGHFKDIKIKNDKSLLSVILISTVFVWIFEAGAPWFVALSLGISLPFYIIFGIVSVSTMTLIFSVLPAGIGTLDLSFIFLLSLVNIPMETGVSILLIYRFFSIALPFLSAIFILNYYNLSLKDIGKR
jgi:glycosyltransferase 2 family protein